MNKQEVITRLEETLNELTASVSELGEDDLNWLSAERAYSDAVDRVRALALKAAHEYRERGEPTPEHVESAMVFMPGERGVEKAFSDCELLRAIETRDEPTQQNAAGKLVEKHTARLKKLIVAHLQRKNCNQPAVHVKEVMSDTWMSVFGHLRNLRDPKKFEQWLITIGRNEANRHLRSCIAGQVSSFQITAGFVCPPAQISGYYHSRDAAIDAGRMLSYAEGISEEFGSIFRLYNEKDLGFDEIAHRLGKNEQAIRTLYYRGLRKLKGRFKPENTKQGA